MSRILGYLNYIRLDSLTDFTETNEFIDAKMRSLKPIVDLHDYCLNEFLRILLLKMNT